MNRVLLTALSVMSLLTLTARTAVADETFSTYYSLTTWANFQPSYDIVAASPADGLTTEPLPANTGVQFWHGLNPASFVSLDQPPPDPIATLEPTPPELLPPDGELPPEPPITVIDPDPILTLKPVLPDVQPEPPVLVDEGTPPSLEPDPVVVVEPPMWVVDPLPPEFQPEPPVLVDEGTPPAVEPDPIVVVDPPIWWWIDPLPPEFQPEPPVLVDEGTPPAVEPDPGVVVDPLPPEFQPEPPVLVDEGTPPTLEPDPVVVVDPPITVGWGPDGEPVDNPIVVGRPWLVEQPDGSFVTVTWGAVYYSYPPEVAMTFRGSELPDNTPLFATTNAAPLTAELSANVSAVPVPAAVWLFASALAGFAAVGKRRLKR